MIKATKTIRVEHIVKKLKENTKNKPKEKITLPDIKRVYKSFFPLASKSDIEYCATAFYCSLHENKVNW